MLPLQNKSMHYSKASRNSTISPWHCAYEISQSRPIFTTVCTNGQTRNHQSTPYPGKPPMLRHGGRLDLAQRAHSMATAWPQSKSPVRAERCWQLQHRPGPSWQLLGPPPGAAWPGLAPARHRHGSRPMTYTGTPALLTVNYICRKRTPGTDNPEPGSVLSI